jgi:hypothetical protein
VDAPETDTVLIGVAPFKKPRLRGATGYCQGLRCLLENPVPAIAPRGYAKGIRERLPKKRGESSTVISFKDSEILIGAEPVIGIGGNLRCESPNTFFGLGAGLRAAKKGAFAVGLTGNDAEIPTNRRDRTIGEV